MKTFFLVSDITVIILALIPSCFALITLIVQAAINARVKRVDATITKVDIKQDKNIDQMDGHMKELLKRTDSSARAEGKIEGKEEQKAKMVPIIEEKVKAAKDAGKVEGFEQANGGHKEESSNQ